MPDPQPNIDREELATQYFEQLPFSPYRIQEEALLAWFTCQQGVLVCAPTGTGKTLIAEAALFEALQRGMRAYYTTPLIALTEQKLQEMQAAAIRWGFSADDVGLVTGNRRINADAPILVVVAEILFNRLLHPEAFQFDDVCAVVMDEFHSFNDPERGIVWEFSLGLLPRHVRLLLLSATVGNAYEFVQWMRREHERKLELVQGDERKVPLTYRWSGDTLLTELMEEMAQGEETNRRTPALVFCFNRDECWDVAEQLKGKRLLRDGQQATLAARLEHLDLSQGAGPKLKQVLLRGVGVHHAGILPKYKRIVERLFQEKLLSVVACTETLAAGINLPARSVVIPNLLKGPPDNKKLIDPSAAHQMFGRAGRPQFDTEGFIYALAHEDDVKILRWREKYDQIPDDTKDPKLRQAKKALKKKMPTRRANQQYWNESQFEFLRKAPPGKLRSRGAFPWRLLAYMLDASPEIEPIRTLVRKRMLEPKHVEQALKDLDHMLMILWTGGYVQLEPRPRSPVAGPNPVMPPVTASGGTATSAPETEVDRPRLAIATEQLKRLLCFRGVNPLYGVYLINQLGIADQVERLQAMESALEMPGSVARLVRVPGPDQLAPGPLATTRLDSQLLTLGLATVAELTGVVNEEEEEADSQAGWHDGEPPPRALTLADKLKRLFDHDFPGVHQLFVQPVWVANELLQYGGDFNKYITSNRLQKQEGIIFRHLLRLILLIGEFTQLTPPETTTEEWRGMLMSVREQLSRCCHAVDPSSTDHALQSENLE